jgi:curved DNA-binding protein CbpA
MNPYETLGVKPDATTEEIRAAFRRKASLHHPDRDGGDHEAMAPVTAAYLVLKDPEKRAHFDATGNSAAPRLPALGIIANLLQNIVGNAYDTETVDLVGAMRKGLEQGIAAGVQANAQIAIKNSATERLIARLKRKTPGENELAAMLQADIRNRNEAVKKNDILIAQHRECLAFLEDYECETNAFPIQVTWFAQPTGTSG